MARLTESQWGEARADCEVRNMSNNAIAKKHGVSEAAVRKRRQQEGWVNGESSNLIDANLNVIKQISEIESSSSNLSNFHIAAIQDEVRFRLQNDEDLQAIQNKVNQLALAIDNPAHALALMTATIRHREARLGKSPEVAVQINNNQSPEFESNYLKRIQSDFER